jgi:cytoskeletal protein RodZ
MRGRDPGAMTENAHPAIVARRQRIHRIRVRIAATAVGVFVAVFSVIWAQLPATASTTTAQSSNTTTTSSDNSSATSASSSPTPMTTSQS